MVCEVVVSEVSIKRESNVRVKLGRGKGKKK